MELAGGERPGPDEHDIAAVPNFGFGAATLPVVTDILCRLAFSTCVLVWLCNYCTFALSAAKLTEDGTNNCV
jgi:hypothetical protein